LAVRAVVPESHPLTRRLLLVLAVACGLSVANIYYSQPLLADIGRTFSVSARQLGVLSMMTQIGYAVGLFLFVPLGDRFEQRRLIVVMLGVVACMLAAVALAPTLLWLYIASLLMGVTTVVPQLIVPLAANLAREEERGKVVGTVMSGLLIGVLLARTFAGFVGAWFGWRSMFGVAAALMVVLGIVLYLLLPVRHPDSKTAYRDILASLFRLTRELGPLREAAAMGGLLFGAFSVFWTTLVFRLGSPPYHYGSEVAGLFGLVGVAGASIAPVAGRLADRQSPRRVAAMGALFTLLSFVLFAVLDDWLWGLVFCVILLDLGVQGAQISNQARIYSLRPDARNRLNTVYMVTYFVGGALGSALGADAWSAFGWPGVCVVGGVFALLAVYLGWRPTRSLAVKAEK